MNYRKRKKFWTKLRDKITKKLLANGPDYVRESSLKYVLHQLKVLKNEKRSKKLAKTA